MEATAYPIVQLPRFLDEPNLRPDEPILRATIRLVMYDVDRGVEDVLGLQPATLKYGIVPVEHASGLTCFKIDQLPGRHVCVFALFTFITRRN